MRLFIAIELDEPARRHLVKVREQLEPLAGRVSWTRGENLHLTLKFLGEVEDPRVPEVCDGLRAIAGPKMQLAAMGMQCFPPRGVIRVVGAKIEGDGAALGDLAERIEDVSFELGFRREGRAYRPHVTLARARAPVSGGKRTEFEEATRTLFPGPSWRAERFVLMQSKLDSRGSQYTVVAHYDLGTSH